MAIPKKTNKGTMIAIDIGANSMKVIQGKVDRSSITIDKAVSVPLKEDIYNDGRVYNADLLSERIKGAVRDNRMSAIDTVITINTSSAIVRELTLPAVKSGDLNEMIGYEIQQYLPIELSQYVIQYRVVGDVVENGTKFSNILVAALPKEVVESHFSLIQAAGLNPVALDINANCVGKLFSGRKINGSYNLKKQTAVFIDIGHMQTNMSVFDRGIYQFDRLLKMGVNDVDNNIASISGKYLDEARVIRTDLQNINYEVEDTDEEGRIINAVRTTVDSWMEEMMRIFKFYTSRKTLNKIDVIYMYGGGSNIKGLDVYLERSLGYKVELITDIEGVKINEYGSTEIKDEKSLIDNNSYGVQKFINALGALVRL